MSVKKKSSIENIFIFRESEKSLKKTPLGFIFVINEFNEPEKKRKRLETLKIGLKSMIKVLKLMLDDFFHFLGSEKKSKQTYLYTILFYSYPCKKITKAISFPRIF